MLFKFQWVWVLSVFIFISGCSKPLVDVSVVDELTIFKFELTCSGQNACSPGQTSTVNLGVGPKSELASNLTIESIDAIAIIIDDENQTYILTNFDETELIQNLTQGGKPEISIPFTSPMISWGTHPVNIIVNYSTRGERKTENFPTSIEIAKPKIEINMNPPCWFILCYWGQYNDYNFIKIKNGENTSFDNVSLKIQVQEGPEIVGSVRRSPFEKDEQKSEQSYASVFQTGQFSLPPSETFSDTEAKIRLPQGKVATWYTVNAQLVWTINGKELIFDEEEKGLYLNEDPGFS